MGETFLRFAAALTCFTLALSSVFAQSQTVVVVASAPVRIMADASRIPLTTLRPGATLRVEEHEGDWYRVSFRDVRWGWRVGYVRAEHVSPETPAVPQNAVIARPVGESDVAAVESAEPKPPSAVPTAAPPLASASTPVRMPERPADVSRSGGLSKRAISESIAIGRRQRNRTQGLQVIDSARQFPAAFGGVDGTGRTPSTGLRLQVFTPLAWIRQLAGEARTENRKFGLDHVSDEASEPVLRVIAYLKVSNTGASSGVSRTAAVEHVVLRDPNTGMVVQPTFKEPFQRKAANAMDGRAAFDGLLVKFPMDAVRELRRASEDHEFFITVIGSTRETRDFRVKKNDFDKLPGAR
jgi:hypothetical protein